MTEIMSTPSLASRHADLTQQAILDAAVALLEIAPFGELTVRAVAARAGMSERTVFRYFANREELLDALASEYTRRVGLPPYPTTIEGLLDYPGAMYARFEATQALTRATLHSELSHRIRGAHSARRVEAIRALLDRHAPKASAHERRIAAANIRYYLAATTWHYFRFYLDFSAEDTVQCACTAIAQSLVGLGIALQVKHRRNRRAARRP